jgi:cobaltochelatase CobS
LRTPLLSGCDIRLAWGLSHEKRLGNMRDWKEYLTVTCGQPTLDWSGYGDEDAAKLARKLVNVHSVVGLQAARDQGRKAHAVWQATMATEVHGGDGVGDAVREWMTGEKAEFRKLVRAAVTEVAKGIIQPEKQKIEIIVPALPPIDATGEHEMFGKLLSLLALRQHTYLVGPAGTGKTESAQRAAAALGMRWSYWAANPTATAAALLGYQDANGRYVSTPFRDMYEGGGVFILDELDNSRDDLPTTLNGAMSGSYGAFPDGLVKRHPDFVVVATGNTWGKGASRIYSGRRQLDGATLNRFVKLAWDYDEELEMRIAPVPEWTSFVQALRRQVLSHGIREVVSMRQSISGGTLLLAGWAWPDVVRAVLTEGWAEDAMSKVSYIIDDPKWTDAARRVTATLRK